MLKFPDGSGGHDLARTLEGLVARWFPGGAMLEPLGRCGFSGSTLVLVHPAGHDRHVLKAFATGMNRSQAEWIHRVARDVSTRGGHGVIPLVRTSMNGNSVMSSGDGRLWEMVAYVDGLAVATPARAQMMCAMQALAGLHLALATVPGEPPRVAESRALAERIARARQLRERPWRRGFASAPRPTAWAHDVGAALARACDTFEAQDGDAVLQKMATLVAPSLPCQVVLRDVWSDHVLFDRHAQDRVVGIVDVHAMGMDTPATDVARLLGSWLPVDAPADGAWWNAAIDAYETVRPLGDRERRLVPMLAATGIIFGLDNWLRWTLDEGRTFPSREGVLSRIAWLVARVPTALSVLSRS